MDDKEKNSSFIKKIIKFLIIFILIIISILIYSRYIGTRKINVKEYKIVNKNLSDNLYGLKIVHISDIYYGSTILKDDLKEIVDQINLIKPDIVVFTGDLIDPNYKSDKDITNDISEVLSNIKVTIGKYAIKGDKDYNLDKWDLIMENSGFTNINDQYELIYTGTNNYILLAGISTNTYDNNINDKLKETNEYISTLSDDNKFNYSILLMHESDFIDKIDISNYNLILAGHSLNGQVNLPIIKEILLPKYGKKYYDNYYKKNTTDIYISSGIGTDKIKFRLFNRPSINFYRLTNR